VGLNDYFLVIWTDTEPVADGLAAATQAHAGQLLAAGPVHDVSELDARPAPAGLVLARFGADESARAWLADRGNRIDGTALLVGGATEPIWWPAEMDAQRPEWSRRADFPPDRLGLFVCVWAEIGDPDQFFDYSVHYRWTVEDGGGVVLVPGSKPSQVVLRGGPGPHAMALMAWPRDEQARRAWYEGSNYRPYRDQRHRSSRTTNVSVRALSAR
jgi:uncharacterized protein (DUF1330 family)